MPRSYEGSHPWIRFQMALDLPREFWRLLGESQSKCDHLAAVPLRDDIARDLYTLYLAKGALATAAIEGNTLTEEDAIAEVRGELQVSPSREYQRQELQNIIDACNSIDAFLMENGPQPITPKLIREWNADVLHGLEHEDDVLPGEFRQHSVAVGGVYRGAPAEDVGYLMDRLCDWLNDPEFNRQLVEFLGASGAAIVKAVVAHVYIAWIHPFGDGNGRTARLLEFAILEGQGIPSASAHLLSNHYNLTREMYYRALAESSRNGGDLRPFVVYALRGFVDGLREQIKRITDDYLLELVWRDFVDTQLERSTASNQRKERWKTLAIALFRLPEGHRRMRKSDIHKLSPEVAYLYAGKESKTRTRDINEMRALHLIRGQSIIEARRDLIVGLRPPTVQPNHDDIDAA
jgi:Fic family protein